MLVVKEEPEAGFALEHPEQDRVRCGLGQQPLEDEGSAAVHVPGEERLGHAALTEAAEDLELADLANRCRLRLRSEQGDRSSAVTSLVVRSLKSGAPGPP